MLLIELSEILNVIQFCEFTNWYNTQKPKEPLFIKLPDGRTMSWYEEYLVHEFLTGPTEPPKEVRIHGPSL